MLINLVFCSWNYYACFYDLKLLLTTWKLRHWPFWLSCRSTIIYSRASQLWSPLLKAVPSLGKDHPSRKETTLQLWMLLLHSLFLSPCTGTSSSWPLFKASSIKFSRTWRFLCCCENEWIRVTRIYRQLTWLAGFDSAENYWTMIGQKLRCSINFFSAEKYHVKVFNHSAPSVVQ